ncbi:MAG: DNA repair protein RecO [Candidatus Omnitrophica bacterium CG1_02_40_15]|nr:MAG: DNA repair protein RecO [Candidatus Omnitrophica bacterium CG1_02_40_15]
MAIQKTEAILLRKKDFRETSLILTFFTKGFGKINGIIKGARGSRPRSDANPIFFSLDQIVFYEKRTGGVSIISQCEAQEVFLNILKEWGRASSAYYMLELTDVFTEPEGKSEEVFENLYNSFKSLDSGKEAKSITRFFEIKLLMALGFWPGAGYFKLTKGAMSSVMHLEKESWKAASNMKLTKDVDSEIKGITAKIIEENLDRPLKTVRFLNNN